MAKLKSEDKANGRVNLEELSNKDRDFLTLDASKISKKYKVDAKSIYSRKYFLNKKIKQAGLSLDEVLNSNTKPQEQPAVEEAKPEKRKYVRKAEPAVADAKPAKRKYNRKVVNIPEPSKPEATNPETVVHESPSRELAVVNKTVPVLMKPIEITFENFSIKLNGVPKKIAVNPETNAIEIDL